MERLAHLMRVSRVLMTARSAHGEVLDFPVRLAVVSDDVAYFAVWSDAPQARTLREDPNVRLAFCNFRGRPGGSDQPALAVASDASEARAALEAKWPVWFRLWVSGRSLVRRGRLEFYRLTPADEPTPWAVGLR